MDKELIISKMEQEKDKLEQQIEMIKNLEIKPVTQEEWARLCETLIRHSNIILDIAKETFPSGYNFAKDSNYVVFHIDKFKVQVPIHRSSVIKIDSKWYKHSYAEYEKPKKHHLKMRRYFDLLDSGKYTWYDLACCRNNCYEDFGKFKLFIWWFAKAKWRKIDRNKWEKEFAFDDRQYYQKIWQQEEKMQRVEKDKLKFIECVKELSEFGQIYTTMNFNGLYGATVTVEEFIAAMNK